jgi:hypothetical protein
MEGNTMKNRNILTYWILSQVYLHLIVDGPTDALGLVAEFKLRAWKELTLDEMAAINVLRGWSYSKCIYDPIANAVAAEVAVGFSDAVAAEELESTRAAWRVTRA